MLQIRQKTFETNSSSMHAIVLESGGISRPSEVRLNVEYIEDLKYDWTGDDVDKPNLKASYLVSYGFDKEALAKIIHDFCGAKLYDGSQEVNFSNVYDNQITDEINKLRIPFIKNVDILCEFIFNSAYKIKFRNDNGSLYRDCYEEDDYTYKSNVLLVKHLG